jgi:hypothetical protein
MLVGASAARSLRAEAQRLGQIGLQTWRSPVADATARPLSKITPMSHDDLRGWVGLGFVALSAWYLGNTLARFLRSR